MDIFDYYFNSDNELAATSETSPAKPNTSVQLFLVGPEKLQELKDYKLKSVDKLENPKTLTPNPLFKPVQSFAHSLVDYSQKVKQSQSEDTRFKSGSIMPIQKSKTTSDQGSLTNEGSGGCSCRKTMCLKLYCECFSNGGVCVPSCRCDNCHNIEELQDLRELIMQETVQKNPLAFKSKFKKMDKEESVLHSRGCNCSKSGCKKRYCECYRGGIGCSKLCKCQNCKNEQLNKDETELYKYHERVLRKRKKPTYLYDFYFNKYSQLKGSKHE